jgi:antitoxin component of MazEF toxin-antitoxin module
MPATLRKWGNRLVIRVPSAVADRLEWKSGTPVELDANCGVLTIRPIRRKPRVKLSALLKQFKPRHRQTEVHSDGRRGAELL